MSLSYENTKVMVLDSLYEHLVQHANDEEKSRSSLAYVMYDFEMEYSAEEKLLIDVCTFVLADKLYQNTYFSKLLKENITNAIPKILISLLRQLEIRDKDYLLRDLYLLGFINTRQEIELK